MRSSGSALVSPDRRYRYWLRRRWGDANPARWSNRHQVAVFVMLNPSTADAAFDDPTIRRCVAFARKWGLGGLLVVNVYAYRATSPLELRRVPDPVGPDNDVWLAKALGMAEQLGAPAVAAWGALAAPERVETVLSLPGAARLLALQVNKDGSPAHPLYLRADSELRPFREAVARASTSEA